MAEFVGREPISVGVDEPIMFENKTDTAFDVGCGIVFRKSGLYRVFIVGRYVSVAIEPERKMGKWLDGYQYGYKCSECGGYLEIDCGDVEMNYCPNCGVDMRGENNEKTT